MKIHELIENEQLDELNLAGIGSAVGKGLNAAGKAVGGAVGSVVGGAQQFGRGVKAGYLGSKNTVGGEQQPATAPAGNQPAQGGTAAAGGAPADQQAQAGASPAAGGTPAAQGGAAPADQQAQGGAAPAGNAAPKEIPVGTKITDPDTGEEYEKVAPDASGATWKNVARNLMMKTTGIGSPGGRLDQEAAKTLGAAPEGNAAQNGAPAAQGAPAGNAAPTAQSGPPEMKAAEIVQSLDGVWSKATANQGSQTSAPAVQNQIRAMAKQAGLAGQTIKENKKKITVNYHSKFLNQVI